MTTFKRINPRVLPILFSCLFMLILCGCGNTGALYLPEDSRSASQEPTVAEREVDAAEAEEEEEMEEDEWEGLEASDDPSPDS